MPFCTFVPDRCRCDICGRLYVRRARVQRHCASCGRFVEQFRGEDRLTLIESLRQWAARRGARRIERKLQRIAAGAAIPVAGCAGKVGYG
jgi:hypothetical protein